MTQPLLSVRDLGVEYDTRAGVVRAASSVTFDVEAGQVVGLVGESGSGKTVSSMAITGLAQLLGGRVSGSIRFDGAELTTMSERDLQKMRGRDVAMIFQQAIRSLNPSMKIGRQIAEVITQHQDVSRRAAFRTAVELLDRVGIDDPRRRAYQYPFEFSGGMCQRVMIAVALAGSPKLIIADEPTTALDVSVQKRILDLMLELRDETGAAVLFITHDLGVVAQLCDKVVVMYAGEVVERGDVVDTFYHPLHPYTQGLLDAVPRGRAHRLVSIPGQVPPPTLELPGCRFAERCPHALPGTCDVVPQRLEAVDARAVRCTRSHDLVLEGVAAR